MRRRRASFLVERKVESKIRRRLDQLYDDLVEAGYDEAEVQDVIDDFEDKLIDELDEMDAEEAEEE
jgi:replicative DNA helicase